MSKDEIIRILIEYFEKAFTAVMEADSKELISIVREAIGFIDDLDD